MQIDSKKLQTLIASQGYTNTSLAAAAGLSRQALQGILNKQWAEVRSKTVQGLVRALKLADPSLLWGDALVGYKARVAHEHSTLDFRGLGLPITEPRPLDDLFVAVRVRRVPQLKPDKDCGAAPTENGADSADSARPAEELGGVPLGECLTQHGRLLLRGEPGSGKTTALRHVARSYAKGTQKADGYPPDPLTPLLVRLADYGRARERDGNLSPVRFVLSHIQPDTAASLERPLEEELRCGKCLVLFDGLDEVGRDSGLPAALRDLIARYPDNRFVLTSRVVGLDLGPWHRLSFASYDITRLQEDDIRRFALRWYTSRRGEGGERRRRENERRAEELSAAILSHPPLRELATNPLMLTVLAGLYHANAALPRRRVDLYEKVVEVLLETWEAGKRNARPGDPLHGIVLDPREFAWLLSRLALAMQRQDRVLSSRWWVTEFIQGYLRDTLALPGDEAKDQGDRVLRHLCERSGLLVERGADLFGFSHRTFQEYFAARGILEDSSGENRDAVSLLRPYLYHPRWEEVVRLVGAQLAPTQATALLRIILDDPDPTGRFLKRGLRLALRCLADGTAVADRHLLDQIFSEGGVVGESKWLGIPLDVIDALRDLKPTRHAADVNRMLADIESAAEGALTQGESFALYEAIHEPLWDVTPADGAPGTLFPKEVGGHRMVFVSLAPQLLREDPKTWHAQVFRLLRSRTAKSGVKRILIDEVLRYEAGEDEQVRGVLEDALVRDRSPEVRAACAWALRGAAAHHPATVKRLFRGLREDRSNAVRGACAAALQGVTPRHPSIRTYLIDLLNSSGAEELRRGAVQGLRQVALEDSQLLASFVTRARSPKEAIWVRVACLNIIDDLPGENSEVRECLIAGLDDSTARPVQRFSAQLVAEALAEGRLPWVPSLVARVEETLMAVPNPCPHVLCALNRLLSAKEVRGGVRLERLLGDALAGLGGRVALALVFGSVARREQGHDSDIDLLIIGDVRLKEVAAALHTAEQGLGRVINPALYSPESFQEKYQAGDPFLLEIARNEKLFLKGTADDLRELVAERLSR
jgi:predicted nucleotidyltransferase